MGYDKSKLGKRKGGYYVRKRDDFPSTYVHYNLGDNKTAKKEYSATLQTFARRITGARLAKGYANRVSEVYNTKNNSEIKSILKAAGFLQGTNFTERLSMSLKNVVTNIFSASGVSMTGEKDTRAILNKQKQKLSIMSGEAELLFSNMQTMIENIITTFSQKDVGAYLSLLKATFQGDPEIMNVLNAMKGTGTQVLDKNRMEQLNRGMKAKYNKLVNIMNEIKKHNQTLIGYLRAGGSLNFGSTDFSAGGANSRDLQIAKLADSLAMGIASLGGAMFESLVADMMDLSKGLLIKNVTTGLKSAAKNSKGFYLTNVKHTGATKSTEDRLSFK